MKETNTLYQVENELIRFTLSVADNTWNLEDLRSGVSWGNQGKVGPWVEVRKTGKAAAKRKPLFLHSVVAQDGALHCGFADTAGRDGRLKLVFHLADNALQVYALPDDKLGYATIDLFRCGLDASQADDGKALVPVRMGLLLPAAGKEPLDLSLGTYEYEGVHMAMAGLFKSGAVLLADWGDPYMTLGVTRAIAEGTSRIGISFSLSKTAQSLELRCLGEGDLTTLAEAYKARVTDLGYRVPWEEKLKARPQSARLFGACNVKLWFALARRIDEDLVEQSVEVNWTFDEAASVAEHLKNDLHMEDVLFHLGGWTRYGYDCRHPDIRPANPECGGDEGLADCVRRVQACDYLFCLHDSLGALFLQDHYLLH